MALLESILREGKKIIAAAGIAVTLSCTPAVRAQRDYDLYPDRKAQIALYNMQQIAGQACSAGPLGIRTYPYCERMSFSEQGVEYVEKNCLRVQYQKMGNVNTAVCTADENKRYSISWEEIRKIVPSISAVKVCSEGRGCITFNGFKGNEQAADFAEAMNIYVMER